MSWYKDRVKDHIDASQAVRDAGGMGRAVSYLVGGIKNYADEKYRKKRAKIEDALKSEQMQTKRYVADKNYAGKVDSASISAAAKDRASEAMLKAHKIDFDKEKYRSDSAYRKTIDGKMLDIQRQHVANAGKIQSAGISAGARVKAAAINAGARDRATEAMLNAHKIDFDKEKYKSDTTYRKAIDTKVLDIQKQRVANEGKRYQIDVAKIRGKAKVEAAKVRARAKPKLKLKSSMSYKDVENAVKKKRDFTL